MWVWLERINGDLVIVSDIIDVVHNLVHSVESIGTIWGCADLHVIRMQDPRFDGFMDMGWYCHRETMYHYWRRQDGHEFWVIQAPPRRAKGTILQAMLRKTRSMDVVRLVNIDAFDSFLKVITLEYKCRESWSSPHASSRTFDFPPPTHSYSDTWSLFGTSHLPKPNPVEEVRWRRFICPLHWPSPRGAVDI